ncbi:MAG: histidine phosphatase family protein [Anaerolineae bacterium]|nr:histidine phosphatase family protein [Anaerolineae bacterium]
MLTRLTLVRHGETTWNADGRWQGWAPAPLSERGWTQAQETAEALRAAGLQRIVSSDLRRTRQTAETINALLNLPIAFDRRLREIDVGNWQGLTHSEILELDPENHRLWEDSDRDARRFPDGESFQDLQMRVVEALRDLATLHPGAHLLIMTHGGVIRSAGLAFDPANQAAIMATPIHNCSITRLEAHAAGWRVAEFAQEASRCTW